MSTGILEGLICCLVSFSCFATCCRVTKGCSKDNKPHTMYNRRRRSEDADIYYESHVQEFPPESYRHDKNTFDTHIFAGEEEVECSICLEKYIIGDRLILLMCGHYYHSQCYRRWSNLSDQTEERCPVCQTVV